MQLRQADVDEGVTVLSMFMHGPNFPSPLVEPHSEVTRDISVR